LIVAGIGRYNPMTAAISNRRVCMHACPLERSDITTIKALAGGAKFGRIAALSAVSAGSYHRAVTCFPPAETAAFSVRSRWRS